MICEALSDQMPAIARGETAWDAEEASHLASCAECQGELALVVAVVARRGAAPEFDLDRLAASVTAATQRESVVISLDSRRRRWTRGLVGLAAAAGIALMAYGSRADPERDVVATVPARVTTAIPELDALLEEELRVVLASIEEHETRVNLTPGPLPRLGELTEAELDELLRAVEG